MDNISAEYLAGFVDGDGCIRFLTQGKYCRPLVTVTNTNREIVEYLHSQFGGTFCQRSVTERQKPAWVWAVVSRKAVGFLELIASHLQIKAEQADMVFAWDWLRPGRGRKMDDTWRRQQALLIERMHWLNRRGPNAGPDPGERYMQECAQEALEDPAGYLARHSRIYVGIK